MNPLKIAAFSMATYGVAVLIIGIFYGFFNSGWSVETGALLRMFLRVGVVGYTAWGLYKREKWAWWLAVVLTPLYAGLVILGLVASMKFDLFTRRPYPALDVTIFVISIVSLTVCFISLFHPASRREINALVKKS